MILFYVLVFQKKEEIAKLTLFGQQTVCTVTV